MDEKPESLRRFIDDVPKMRHQVRVHLLRDLPSGVVIAHRRRVVGPFWRLIGSQEPIDAMPLSPQRLPNR